jgi:tRNA(fMet)-specific endonuclease VapC
MGCVIDSCIIINAERNQENIASRIANIADENFYISVITASELLYGIHRAKNFTIKNRRKAFVEDVLLKFPILSNDLSVARMHAEIWAELTAQGTLIGSHDLWIAATCLANNYVLLTDNKKDFAKVPGLKLL